RRGHVRIELVPGDHAHAVVFPAIVIMRVARMPVVGMPVVGMRVVVTGHCSAFHLETVASQANQCHGIEPSQNRNSRSRPALFFQREWKEIVMGSTTDKVKGATNEAIGKAKQGIGEATGSDRMKGEGAMQEIKGKGQKAMGETKDAAKEAVDRAAASAKR